MLSQLSRILERAVIAMLIFQLAGCGTIFYPERRNQKVGNLDVGVVLLDAIGLLFFIIPGVIAFAVDFSTGAIYLPATKRAQIRQIRFDPKHTSIAQIEKIIKEETGRDVRLTQSDMQVSRLNSRDEMLSCLAQVPPDIHKCAGK